MSPVDLQRYLVVLWKWAWLLILATGVAAGVGYYTTRAQPNVYVSSTTILVGEAFRNPNPVSGEFSTAQQLAETYAQMVQRQPILEATIKALNLPLSWGELQRRVIAVHLWGSQTFEIRVSDTDPVRARTIAAGIADQLIASSPTETSRRQRESHREFIRSELDVQQQKIQRAVQELEEKRAILGRETSARAVLDRQDEIQALELNLQSWRSTYATLLSSYEGGTSPNVLTVIEPASTPIQPTGPNALWYVLSAALAGALLAVAGVLVLEYLDDTVKSKQDVERALGVPSLGVTLRLPALDRKASPLVVLQQPDSPAAEAYHLFATNTRFAMLGSSSAVLLITSPDPRAGKSATAANLALVLAQSGKRVLLVDLDLRQPALHALFGVPNDLGVTSMLLNPDLRAVDCVVQTPLPHLKLLPSGPVPPNPAELLSRFGEPLVREFRSLADVVIVDSPPLLAAADAVMLAILVDGTVLLAKNGQTRRGSCRAAREALDRVQAQLLGAALTFAPDSEVGLYGYWKELRRPRLLGLRLPRFRRDVRPK